MNQSETLGELAKALAKFQAQTHGATKNATNPHLKNKYADLGSVWEAVREPLTANGLSVVQLPNPGENGTLRLVTRLLHTSGEWLQSEIQMPLGKADPQGYGSALGYARRYGLASLLGIVQEDDDGEGAMKRPPQADTRTGGTPPKSAGGANTDTLSAIAAEVKRLSWASAHATNYIKKHFNKKGSSELNQEEAAEMLADLKGRDAAIEKALAEAEPA